ncbi:glycosyltransferase [Natrinema salifodinae]|uniref:Glycosyltransferase involved in cell wall bisynthesis n=1 Tax=Natrinema salifodinae TaxID=1202768 RepID=A0A1I0M019_9EURY|nr:glycosyltransferase [Natrinema salifodinae]SEV81734.1 Glycosyltransferase involved in cell wall bisynthesis [Natrinema salifodinae]
MKVCYLINQLAPGGAPTLLLDIIRQNNSSEIEYTVAFIEGDSTLIEDFQETGTRIVNFDAEFKFDPRAMWRLGRFFHRESFDIVHTHLPYAQTLGRVATLLGDHGAIISTQHNFSYHYHPVTRTTERITRSLDDVTIAVSQAVKSEFIGQEEELKSQWQTIYNGANVTEIAANVDAADGTVVRERFNIPRHHDLFLCVGRYVEQKSQSDIIRAISIMNASDIHLVLVGWGPYENKLRTLADKYDVSDRVTVTGRVPEVWPYYAAADTFVSASTIESFGIVLVEAMAAGLPIVATDVPGAREVLQSAKQGVKDVPPNDPEELADALTRIMNNSLDVDYDNALEKFNIEKTSEAHLELYQDIQKSN